MNNENLIPQAHVLTDEERRAGGYASAKARREKRSMREDAQFILSLLVQSGEQYEPDQIVELAEMNNKEISVQTAALMAQAEKAINGDWKAFEILRDTAGEKPMDKNELSLNVPVLFEGEDKLE